MPAAEWIAGYAAVVGTAGLAWQASSQIRDRQSKVSVGLALVHRLETIEDVEAFGPPTESLEQIAWHVEVNVVNLKHRPVRLDFVSVARTPVDGSPATDHWMRRQWDLPWTIEGEDGRTVVIDHEAAGPLRVGDRLQAFARTHKGKLFSSDEIVVGPSMGGEVFVAVRMSTLKTALKGRPLDSIARVHEMHVFDDDTDEASE